MQNKILIVEDSADSREFLKVLLEQSDYEVTEAQNGEEGVTSAACNHPNLILMDIDMPVMNGIIATKIIRKIKELVKTPVIAVTSNGNFYRSDAISTGFNDLITKPINFGKLNSLLKQYLPV